MLDLRHGPRPVVGSATFRSWPATAAGRLAGGLAATFVALIVVWLVAATVHGDAAMSVTLGALRLAPLVGASASACALVAILGQREHSWVVWLGLLPGMALIAVAALELLWLE
jgi:hypothetical protein